VQDVLAEHTGGACGHPQSLHAAVPPMQPDAIRRLRGSLQGMPAAADKNAPCISARE
jgi:hypothetical protein